jgi:KUP system potassium uptake protein
VKGNHSSLSVLTLGAIGVVYGDIGTSPLYAFKEVFASGNVPVTTGNILGVLSLLFWTPAIIVSIKYVVLIMRADNQGEGGLMALLTLASQSVLDKPKIRRNLMILGVFGVALFFGDGVITPAVSVLSAVEGLETVTPAAKPYILSISLTVLFLLFLVQKRGTDMLGKFLGPIMVVWFLAIGLMGLLPIFHHPEVLESVSPYYAVQFAVVHDQLAFVTLGAVFLCVTGAEALYADMGHFGKRPIRIAWFGLVMPCLMLNYFGQGALVLANPTVVKNPFFLMMPSWASIPMVALATVATVIASQALISGAFSATKQTIQLGYLPRLTILHTSHKDTGQIYVPAVNWALLFGVVMSVVIFGSSSTLAAAYGISVSLVMAGSLYLVLATWKDGRRLIKQKIQADAVDLPSFLDAVFAYPPTRSEGSAAFLTASPGVVPNALLHNLKHNKVLHKINLFLTVQNEEIPKVAPQDRVSIAALGNDCWQVVIKFGFLDDLDIPKGLQQISGPQWRYDAMTISYFLSRDIVVPTRGGKMSLWRKKLFAQMHHSASGAASFLNLPSNAVVELGANVVI